MQSTALYESDNIIVGSAELPAVKTKKGLCWILPGNKIECDREVATAYAEKLDRMIRSNMKKFSRTLFH